MASLSESSRKNLWVLLQAVAVSRVGSQLSYGVLAIWAAYHFNSGFYAGLLSGVPMIAGVLTSLFAAPLIDRVPALRTMMASDAANSFLAFVTGLAIFLITNSPFAGFVMVILTRTFSSVASSLFEPAAQVILPAIVERSELMAANSRVSATKNATAILGTSLSGALYAAVGPAALFFLDAFTYFTSVIVLKRLKPRYAATPPATRLTWLRYREELAEGYQYCRAQRGLMVLLASALGLNFMAQPIALVLAFYNKDTLQLGPEWLGYILTVFTIANLISSMSAARWQAFTKMSPHQMFVSHILVIGLSQLMLFAAPSLAMSFIAIGIMGFAQGPINIVLMTAIQTKTPTALQGRVQSTLMALFGFAGPIGTLVAGAALDFLKGSVQFWFLGTFIASLVTILITARSKVLAEYLHIDMGSCPSSEPKQDLSTHGTRKTIRHSESHDLARKAADA